MSDQSEQSFRALVFKNRGLLLALPAAALVLRGKPSAFSAVVGVPIAIAGELLRCWAVGFSGVTTRGDHVEAPRLATNGPYAYVRNPLYLGNGITALGFAIAFTGGLPSAARRAMIGLGLGLMAGVYSVIVPHEEAFLRETFGEEFEIYTERVPRVLPRATPYNRASGDFDAGVIAKAESRTFVTFGIMLAALALRAKQADE